MWLPRSRSVRGYCKPHTGKEMVAQRQGCREVDPCEDTVSDLPDLHRLQMLSSCREVDPCEDTVRLAQASKHISQPQLPRSRSVRGYCK